MPNIKKIVIVGPTASGKTALSLNVAKKYNGEIVAADSRTVYKDMNIGTAKPTTLEQSQVAHYCLDIVKPNELFTVADFVEAAKYALTRIEARGKLPIIVGGSGLFVDSLIYDFTFTKPNPMLREQYKNYSTEQLKEEIARKGLELPENSSNKRYLQNTLERQGTRGTKKEISKGTLIIGIAPGKEDLNERIAIRANHMIKNGVVQEMRGLINEYGPDCLAFNGGIYKLLPDYIDGSISKTELTKSIVKSDMKLSKKQLTWFRRNKDVIWFKDIKAAEHWLSERLSDTIN